MALVIETALAVGGLSWAFEKVLEHTVGGVGKDACTSLARIVWRELAETADPPGNHDIARAVRAAQLDVQNRAQR